METKKVIEATCPDCRGPLSEITSRMDGEENVEYRCLVEHKYSARGLLNAHSEMQEKALWAAVVALEEAAVLVNQVKHEFPSAVAQRLEQQADQKLKQARDIRAVLKKLEAFQTQ